MQLVPCYRGYTVDSLAGLTSLDDSDITALEREQVSGMVDCCNRRTGNPSPPPPPLLYLLPQQLNMADNGFLLAELIRCATVHIRVKSMGGLPELKEVGVV